MKLSVVILTKNEEKNISEAIQSVDFADEIIIIDDISSDKTVEIANSKSIKVYKRRLNGDFAGQRNYGLYKAKNEWVLFLDADERPSKGLVDELITMKDEPVYDGFKIKRKDFIWGKKLRYGETGSIKLLRLARKGAGKWKRKVHEYWDIIGNVGELKNPILHYPHQTIKEFINDIDYFSTLHAEANRQEGKKSSLLKIIFWQRFKFFNNWILKLGFLDGTQGFIMALMMSFHSFLAWSKLWLMQRK